MGIFNRFFGTTNPENEENVSSPASDSSEEETHPRPPSREPARQHDTPTPMPPTTLPMDGATRQLPAEKFISASNAHLAFGQSSDVGMVRNNNQDSALSFFSTSSSVDEIPDFGIFMVADGMGGHYDGEKASAMTTRIVANEITTQIYLPIVSGSEAVDLPPISEVLVAAVQKANNEVHRQIPKGGGTTCTAVVVLGDRAYIGHVGDSRAYLITKDGMEQITRDHSMVQRLVELGQLNPEEASTYERRNELYRALGFKDNVEVDTLSRRMPPGSRLLLCSDGLWNHVEGPDMLNVVLNNPNPQEACNKLVALANTRGGSDNITVLLLRMG